MTTIHKFSLKIISALLGHLPDLGNILDLLDFCMEGVKNRLFSYS